MEKFFFLIYLKFVAISNFTGQQNLTFFPRTLIGELSSIFMLISDTYTEVFYQEWFQRYRGI